MPKKNLTDLFCQTAKPVGGKKVEYFDTTVQGLSLLVTAAGARTFYFSYTRPGDRKRARIKLGRYPDILLGTTKERVGARDKARAEREKVQGGHDPVAEKRAEAQALTVYNLVEDYLTLNPKVIGNKTRDRIARRMRMNISGYNADHTPIEGAYVGCIGDVKLKELDKAWINKPLDAAVLRGAEVEANRIFADIRAMVRWSYGTRGTLTVNICDLMKKPGAESTPGTHWLKDEELGVMWRSLGACNQMQNGTKNILRLMLMSAQRVSEVAGMCRSELDLDEAVWVIPAARMKNNREHLVPLTPAMVGVIRAQIEHVRWNYERRNQPAPDFVFPAPGAKRAIMNTGVAQALRRQMTDPKDGPVTLLGVEPFTSHDLRRTAASHMAKLGVTEFDRALVLSHISTTKSSVTSEHYDCYEYEEEKRRALDRWADRLGALLRGDAPALLSPKAQREARKAQREQLAA